MEELLELTRENNRMLKAIYNYLKEEAKHDDKEDFIRNIVANIMGNYMT